jgi:osmotically-inducible protein OsmY
MLSGVVEGSMIRTLLRLLVIVLVLVAIGAFFTGYRWGRPDREPASDRPVGTSGAVNTSRARETGAEIGEKVAVGANKAERALEEAQLTAKIKSKMALDDTVSATAINVDTDAGIVTLSGTVRSTAEHARAVQLARETEGVKRVVDRLHIR